MESFLDTTEIKSTYFLTILFLFLSAASSYFILSISLHVSRAPQKMI